MKHKSNIKRYMTIKERREYMLTHENEIPISFDPRECLNPKKKSDRKYVTTLVSGGDSSLIVKVKKGTRMLFGGSESPFFGIVGEKKDIKKKVLSLFRK